MQTNIPRASPAQLRRREPPSRSTHTRPRSRHAGVARRDARWTGACSAEATSEEKTQHDEAADPSNTTRLKTTMKMCYLDNRPTSERHRADRVQRRAALEPACEYVFLPAAVRGRVARRKEEEGLGAFTCRGTTARTNA